MALDGRNVGARPAPARWHFVGTSHVTTGNPLATLHFPDVCRLVVLPGLLRVASTCRVPLVLLVLVLLAVAFFGRFFGGLLLLLRAASALVLAPSAALGLVYGKDGLHD